MAHDKDPTELELKFSLDRGAADTISRHRLLADQEQRPRAQRTIYFDTPEAVLRSKGYSLRVRAIDDRFTQTVKTRSSEAGLLDRGEWERPVAAMKPDLKALAQTPVKTLGDLNGGLAAVVQCDVERTTWLVDHRDSAIEVVLDSGTVFADGEQQKFDELELELKQGEPAALFSLAREFLEAVPLRLGVLSKQERGEMLDALGASHKAPALSVDDRTTADAVFAQILMSCLRHFRLNEYAVLTDCDHEGLHQARVAMRRLRGALTMFRPAIRQGGLAQLRGEVRWLTSALGEARDLDVFLAAHGGLSRGDRNKLQAAQRAAYDEVKAAIDSQRCRSLMLDLVEWLALGDWRKAEAKTPIAKYASKQLDVLWEAIDQGSPDLAKMSDHRLHRLRIHGKKLRYAVEFVASLYGKQARKFASKLGDIQDGLGVMNDAVIGRALVAGLSLDADPDILFADSRSDRIDALEKQFKALRKVGRFWA